jgi:hypothetical protein
MLAEGSSISFVSLIITCYRQKNKYQLKHLLCASAITRLQFGLKVFQISAQQKAVQRWA